MSRGAPSGLYSRRSTLAKALAVVERQTERERRQTWLRERERRKLKALACRLACSLYAHRGVPRALWLGACSLESGAPRSWSLGQGLEPWAQGLGPASSRLPVNQIVDKSLKDAVGFVVVGYDYDAASSSSQ